MTTTPELTPDDFAAFFTAVHSVPPFPWQDRLLRQVAAEWKWPGLLDLPTGTGKTAALDIAVFHLALEADKGAQRRAPVRIAFVVDRRLIVDDAFERAKGISDALSWSLIGADKAAKLEARYAEQDRPDLIRLLRRARAEPTVGCVAARLGRFAERPETPLLARRLRGGVPREDDWARTPCQPTILCSTVNQVGSRLLFRGYGISDSMKPMHAGLLGADCLILLDEVHLSRPFRQTLQAASQYCKPRDREPAGPAPFALAMLSATPGDISDGHFKLKRDDRHHPVLRERLQAPKPAILREIKGQQGRAIEEQRADELAEAVEIALGHLKRQQLDAPPVIGVVVNRVLRARRIFQNLCKAYGVAEEGELPQADLLLVIGPAREVDRKRLVETLGAIKTGANSARRQLLRPLIVVATQTIEAGADLDFDALVTEIAPLDALKQRFGRLNRAGRAVDARAVILAHREDLRPGKDGDPVYGMAAAATWNALQKLASSRGDGAIVDFGATASDAAPWIGEISPEQIEADGLLASKAEAPVLMPAYVDLWSQTAPIPAADPEVSLFLHGPNRSPATVQIVWRADLERADLELDRPDFDTKALLAAVPPRSAEAIEVSLTAARRWLRALARERPDADGFDFADVAQSEQEEEREPGRSRPAYRWGGPESDRSGTVHARDLRPNDLIVVPADYGGCDEFGWNPQSVKPVRDVANEAALPLASRRFALRLTPSLIAASIPEMDDEAAAAVGESVAAFATAFVELSAALRDGLIKSDAVALIQALREAEAKPSPQIGKLLDGIADWRRQRRPRPQLLLPYGDDEGRPRGVVLVASKGIELSADTAEESELAGGIAATEDDWLGSTPGYVQTLEEHSLCVRDRAADFARTSGLDPVIAMDISLAAYLHDAGKADPRFQTMLYGGDWFAVDEKAILAKSERRVPGAWERAGLPDHWRHEALSVRIAQEHSRFPEASDKELVLWLIGVHHGYGRPLFPHADPRDAHDRDDLTHIEGERFRLEKSAGPQSLAFSFNGYDWAQIFQRLKRRYGVWELARLEAIVRLADHRASEAADRSGAR